MLQKPCSDCDTWSTSPQTVIQEFASRSRDAGWSPIYVGQLAGVSHHLLAWLHQNDFAIETVDDTVVREFVNHECRCQPMAADLPRQDFAWDESGKRRRRMSVLPFVYFLEQAGHIPTPGELEQNLGLLGTFLDHLQGQGYASNSLATYRSACAHFLVWLHRCRTPLAAIDATTLDRFCNHDCVCGYPDLYQCSGRFVDPRSRLLTKIQGFILFLIDEGAVRNFRTEHGEDDPELSAFAIWLRQYRGIGEPSIRRHLRCIAMVLPALRAGSDGLNAARIRTALIPQIADRSRSMTGCILTALRMYLRFQSLRGHCAPELVESVPSIRRWALAPLPKYVSSDVVEHVIASCDGSTPIGLRDRAMVLLLARMALRAGDIADMRLEDIDWDRATIRVSGKSKRQEELDLPQEVGDALFDYIVSGRPRVNESKLFLRSIAPHRPLASLGAVCLRVRRILRRAGVDDTLPAARLFRHSLATSMVREGASLGAVSTVLRHKSHQTTAIYAKVDVPMLRELAQPWAGGDDVSC